MTEMKTKPGRGQNPPELTPRGRSDEEGLTLRTRTGGQNLDKDAGRYGSTHSSQRKEASTLPKYVLSHLQKCKFTQFLFGCKSSSRFLMFLKFRRRLLLCAIGHFPAGRCIFLFCLSTADVSLLCRHFVLMHVILSL